jgi:hypothetical protein
MHISKETLSILKNFRDLNSNIYVVPGNTIKTITPAKNVMAWATVQENFPVEFGLWDLTSFLGTVSLFDDPDFDFQDKYVTISGGKSSRVKYYYSDPSLLTIPTKNVNMPDAVVDIDLDEDIFNELKKAASVLGLPDLSFVSNGSEISAILSDKSNATNNTYSLDISNAKFPEDAEFSFDFKIDHLRFIPGSYRMKIAEKVVSEFQNTTSNLTYWVAVQSTSSYNAAVATTGVA